jgi:endonuclease/exonuclease/phosphatase (EEP) superfamily protein YafD
MVMSRLPARDVGLVRAGPIVVPSLTVDVGGRRVRVHAVHAPNPSPVSRLDRWRSGLAALRRLAERDGGAVVFAGDFNASGFHRAYRSMLGGGLSDAHDERGLGLTPSWGPESNPLPWPDALIRLDHAAYSGSIYPVALQNGEMPGSDHRPFAVTFAVRPRR